MPSKRVPITGALSLTAALTLTGCSAAASAHPEPTQTPTRYIIPYSTHRAPDPVATTGSSKEAGGSGSASAQNTSLSQLWAISNGDPIPADQSNPLAWRIDDFANAIQARCHPQLSAADQAELTSLYASFTRTLEERPLAVDQVRQAKNAYFDRATALCM